MYWRLRALGRAIVDEVRAIDEAFAPIDVLVTAACFLALIAEIDWLTSYEVSLHPLYLLLVMLVTWRCGWKWGLAFAAAAFVNQIGIGLVAGYPYSRPLYFALATLEKLFSSLVVIWLLTRLRIKLEREKPAGDAQMTGANA
jgi:hypothetical protein